MNKRIFLSGLAALALFTTALTSRPLQLTRMPL